MKRKFEMPSKPSASRETEQPPRERRKLGLKFGGGEASDGAAAR